MLFTIESFIAALVAEAINKAKEDYRADISQPREVITQVPASPQHSARQDTLEFLDRPRIAWLFGGGGSIWFVLWTLITGSLIWGLVAIGITAFVVWQFAWVGVVLIAIASVVCLIFLV